MCKLSQGEQVVSGVCKQTKAASVYTVVLSVYNASNVANTTTRITQIFICQPKGVLQEEEQ